MPSICEEFLPVIRTAFREAAQRITDGQQRGSRGLGKVLLGDQHVELGLAFGPHRDKSGDSTIFVSVSGAVIQDRSLTQALANELGYLRTRHTHGAKKRTDFYVTLNPASIEKLASGEGL